MSCVRPAAAFKEDKWVGTETQCKVNAKVGSRAKMKCVRQSRRCGMKTESYVLCTYGPGGAVESCGQC